VHQALDQNWEGLRMIATPSTCSQFKPGSDEFAVDNQHGAVGLIAPRFCAALHLEGGVDPAAVNVLVFLGLCIGIG